jgi:hypothetical protein
MLIGKWLLLPPASTSHKGEFAPCLEFCRLFGRKGPMITFPCQDIQTHIEAQFITTIGGSGCRYRCGHTTSTDDASERGVAHKHCIYCSIVYSGTGILSSQYRRFRVTSSTSCCCTTCWRWGTYGWVWSRCSHRSLQCQTHMDIGNGGQLHEVVLNLEHVHALAEGWDFHPDGLPSL